MEGTDICPSADAPRDAAWRIVRRLQQAGFPAFWVGGCVRDFLLGRDPGDYDIVTSALPEQIERLFPRTIPVGRKFGVVVVVEARPPIPGRHLPRRGGLPGWPPSGAGHLRRRPRPTRAAAISPSTACSTTRCASSCTTGSAARRICAPGSSAPSARPRNGSPKTTCACCARCGLPRNSDFEHRSRRRSPRCKRMRAEDSTRISAERIREELLKLFRPPHAARGLDLLRESGLLEQVLPEIARHDRLRAIARFPSRRAACSTICG